MSDDKVLPGKKISGPVSLNSQHSTDTKRKVGYGALTPERPSLSLKTISGVPNMGRTFFYKKKHHLEKIEEIHEYHS